MRKLRYETISEHIYSENNIRNEILKKSRSCATCKIQIYDTRLIRNINWDTKNPLHYVFQTFSSLPQQADVRGGSVILNYFTPPLCTGSVFNIPDNLFTYILRINMWSPIILLKWKVSDASSHGQETCYVGIIHPQEGHSLLGLQEPFDEFSLQSPNSTRTVKRIFFGREFLVSYHPSTIPKNRSVLVLTNKLIFRLSIQLLQDAMVEENVNVGVVIRMKSPGHMSTVFIDPVETGQSFIGQQAVVITVTSL